MHSGWPLVFGNACMECLNDFRKNQIVVVLEYSMSEANAARGCTT
jgi:hypothetical protein